MDVTAAFKVMEHLTQPSASVKVETKEQKENLPKFVGGPQLIRNILSWTIGIFVGLFAAYLSWTCNTRMSYGVVWKVINAIFAYIFGLIYIFLYVIFRWDVCRKVIQ